MRLRPTGNKGPVAVSLESFRRYHEAEAWTWEHLALTRARAIAGSEELCRDVEAVIRAALAAKADKEGLVRDARDMRRMLADQFPGKNRWDLKFASGGLIDIEFIAQTLQLCTAQTGADVLDTNTIAALRKLEAAHALRSDAAGALVSAAAFQQSLIQVLRIALDGTLNPVTATTSLKALLARAGGCEDFETLDRRLIAHQTAARAIFEGVLGAA